MGEMNPTVVKLAQIRRAMEERARVLNEIVKIPPPTLPAEQSSSPTGKAAAGSKRPREEAPAVPAPSESDTVGTTGITKVKDDGFGPSPTTPLGEGEGDQSRNLVVGQSTLLASNDNDEANEAEIFTKLTKGQKKRLRKQKEAMEAHQTAMVPEKKIMEPPYVSGEKFVKDFLTAFPPLTYHGDKGREEIYAPPIPVKADTNAQINNSKDMSKVGAYPDHVVLSIANERDKLKAQLQQVMEETTKQKMMYLNLCRQAELWRARYYAIANASPVHGPASHGQDSGPV